MSKKIFKEPLDNNFFSNNFGKKYLHKREFINDANNVVSLEILDDMLSKSNVWNNKNFKMMLDQKTLNYNDYSSLSIDITGSNNRPDVDKVQRLVSKGASIILNDIEKYNTNLLKISDELQRLTQGRCQGNLYFSWPAIKHLVHILICMMFLHFILKVKKYGIFTKTLKIPINHPFLILVQKKE